MDPTGSSLPSRRAAAIAWVLFAAIVAVYSVLLLKDLGDGHLEQDSLLTGERSREFLVAETTVTVYQNFTATYAKPPLQYLQTAPLLDWLEDRETAVRLWPAAYGLGCFLLLAWLCRIELPQFPWAVPASALALAASVHFFRYSGRGLLDSGAAFFLLLTVIGVRLARDRPGFWWLAGIAALLGSLQKYSFGLGYLIVAVLLLWVRGEYPRRRLAAELLVPGVVCGAAMLAWPIYQHFNDVHYAGLEFAGSMWDDTLARLAGLSFARVGHQAAHYARAVAVLWGPFGIGAAVAAAAVLGWRRLRRDPQLLGITLFVAGYVLWLLVIGRSADRYLVPITPLLAFVGVITLAEVSRLRPRVFGAVVLLAGVASSLQFRRLERLEYRHFDDQVALAESLGRTLEAGETPFHFLGREDRFHYTVSLFYGDLRRPIYVLDPRQAHRIGEAEQPDDRPYFRWPAPDELGLGPARGVARIDDLGRLRAVFTGLRVSETRGAFALFTADHYGVEPSR